MEFRRGRFRSGQGDDEMISGAQAIEWLALEAVGRAPARFDAKKLESVNAHYIRAAADARLAALVAPRIAALLARPLTDSDRQLLLRSIPELKPIAKDFNELAESALYLFRIRPLNLDEGAPKLLQGDGLSLLAQHRNAQCTIPDWTKNI